MIKFYDDMGASQGISVMNDMSNALGFWTASTAVNVGDTVRSSSATVGTGTDKRLSSANNMIYAVCTAAGTTGTTEPVWGTTAGITLTDNGVSWLVKDMRTADNAVQADKLKTPRKINGVNFDGSADITLPSDSLTNECYIAAGCKVAGFTDKTLSVGSGAAKILGKNIIYPGSSILLDDRKASLVYLDDSTSLGKVNAAYPTDKIDNNTVGFWVFNPTTAGANVPNSAVGVSSAAVANSFVPSGGISSVDGWADYGLKTDGVNGYFELQNNTGFPSGLTEFEINLLFTPEIMDGTADYIFCYAYSNFTMYIDTNGMLVVNGTSTGYAVDVGKTILITVQSDTRNLYVYINGKLIYTQAVAVTLTLSGTQNTRIGCAYDKSDMLAATFHFLEIRNKMRTVQQVGEIANKLMLPCFYSKSASEYPTVPAAYQTTYHEYKFDDATAGTVADSAGTNTGTATGTTQETSKTIGKAMRFAGAITSYVDIGSLTVSNEMTIVAVINPDTFDASSASRFFGSKNSNMTFICALGESGGLGIYTGSWVSSGLKAAANADNFVVIRLHKGAAYFRLNNQIIVKSTSILASPVTCPCAVGGNIWNTANSFKGTISYFGVINSALTDAEIDYMYDKLMATGRRNIIDDVVPSNSVAVGVVRTNSSKVITYNDEDYMYGRREGATGGNRKVFLGWQYFSGAQSLKWANPLGTGKVRREFHWAQDANGTNELQTIGVFFDTAWRGVVPVTTSAGYSDPQNITAFTEPSGVTFLNGVWQTSGYVGCYAEVLEEYKGV